MNASRTWGAAVLIAVVAGLCFDRPVYAAEPIGASKSVAGDTLPADKLAAEQAKIAAQYKDLEKIFLLMAEDTAKTDPKRAALLRQAFQHSQQRAIPGQLDELSKLLDHDQLFKASKSQADLQQDLAKLLELLLSGDRSKQVDSEKARIRQYLARINGLIKLEQGIQTKTTGQGDPKELADQQSKLAEKAAELAKDIERNEGPAHDIQAVKPKSPDDSKNPKNDAPKPGDTKPPDATNPADKGSDDKPPDANPADSKSKSGKPSPAKGQKPPDVKPDDSQSPASPDSPAKPSDDTPGRKRIAAAEERMREAQKKLDEAKRTDAADKQEQAIQELQQAKAELEAILRQLREEQAEHTLAQLETRFRNMLRLQTEVYEGTVSLDKTPPDSRDRDTDIEAGKLNRKESQLVLDAEKALALLRQEGSGVAIPEAVEQMRDDMEQVVGRLAKTSIGPITQGIEKDVMTALEEMIATLQKAQKDKKNQPQFNGQVGEAVDCPLLDQLAELKMIRALQMRVNTRHERYSKLVEGEQAEKPELLEALDRLAEREQRIHRAARNIVQGKNE